jgi:hypothetical protein
VFQKDVSQAANAISRRTVQINAQILQYLFQTLLNKPDLVAPNGSFLEGWLSDLPKGRGLDEQASQLASILRHGAEASPEKFDCPICEEPLSEREEENGMAGQLICSMWHVWSECLTYKLR